MRASHTISAVDLFNNYDISKIKGKGNIKKTYKTGCKKLLAAKVFLRFIEMLIEDMLEGYVFHFPTKNIATFGFKKISGENFKKAYTSGRFNGIDYLVSNFTIYVPIFRYFYGKSFRSKDMVFCERHKEKMIEKTNEGIKYC